MKYLLRLDDAWEKMNWSNWKRMEEILDRYRIKPIVGVIPDNKDKSLDYGDNSYNFWDEIHIWQKKGWEIALHGYDHLYITNDSGINPIHKRSEFAGVDYNIQKNKIKKGYNYLISKNIRIRLFFAPSHTFDENTLKALKEETKIKNISDTFSLTPYKYYGFNFIPQQFGKVRKIPIGVITFCYHPNTMRDIEFIEIEKFIKDNEKNFISFSDLELNKIKNRNIIDIVLQNLYLLIRRIKLWKNK